MLIFYNIDRCVVYFLPSDAVQPSLRTLWNLDILYCQCLWYNRAFMCTYCKKI